MKKYIQVIVDSVMVMLMILLMGYHLQEHIVHEYLGISLFGLFVIHHVLNYRWYFAIHKGKYNTIRKVLVLINILLMIDMILIILSSFMISRNVFSGLHIGSATMGRRIHMAATAWGFVLMSIHLGIHYPKFQKVFERIKYVLIVMSLYGMFSFIKRELWNDLFLLQEFKFFDYTESSWIFYLDYVCILIFIGLIGYFMLFKRYWFMKKYNVEEKNNDS